ncbi:MAG: FG-GAP repeat protein [Gammaproteobacteria bacterium]
MHTKAAMPTGFLCLSFLMSGAAIAATSPTETNASFHAGTALPEALRPGLYQALARDAGPAYSIKQDGCAALPKQQLKACFSAGGVRFAGTNAKPLALHLAAWGRGSALHRIDMIKPAIAGNQARYVHNNITEWWRVLAIGFEQGFTIAKRPAGKGALTLAFAANHKASRQDAGAPNGELAFGKLRYGKFLVTDATGKVVSSTVTAKDHRILIAVNDVHATYPLTIDPLVWVQQQKLTANDGAGYDNFGYSVALDGTTALVGAIYATVGGDTDQGAAYVFTKSGGIWSQTAKLTAADGAAGDQFGNSVALSGTTALVGDDRNGGNQGAAYVFSEAGGTWSQTAKLTAADGAAGDYFGDSVALEGTTAVIGARYATVGGNQLQGAAYVFSEAGGTWSQSQKLTASDGAAEDQFGISVALDRTTALVGAFGANGYQGAAYIFDESGGSWTQSQKLTASDGAGYAYFGYSVAVSGPTVLVSAIGATVGGNSNQGAAYVFTESGGTWTQSAKLTASDGAANDYFGYSVAASGPTVLVGINTDQGAAYVFNESGAGWWSQSAKLTASDGAADDYFGTSVALAGTTVLLGAFGATVDGKPGQGAAYVFSATCPPSYGEQDGALNTGGLYGSPPYEAPAGIENGILGGPGGFQLYAQYSNGGSQHIYPVPGNEVHKRGPAGTYRWGVKAGNTGGDYVLCILHP